MKQILLTITLLLTILPVEAVKKITPNPINLAITLVEKTDSAKVASTLTYYGYTFQNIEDGYNVMKDSNGNEIHFSFKESNSSHKYPTVKVRTEGNHKDLDSKLQELKFEKVGNIYEYKKNQYSKFKTQCNWEHQKTLIVRRIQN